MHEVLIGPRQLRLAFQLARRRVAGLTEDERLERQVVAEELFCLRGLHRIVAAHICAAVALAYGVAFTHTHTCTHNTKQ